MEVKRRPAPKSKRWRTAAALAADFWSRLVDARGTRTVQISSQGKLVSRGAMLLCVLSVMAVQARAGTVAAAVQGVVRDSQGVAQMGALVQVVTANRVTMATAFTDMHGRYLIANLLPGRYQIRASAVLYVPAVRGDLELKTGAYTVVNLTLATLFEGATWLPGERRSPSEPDDDWKWTLRSPVNRPMLRLLDDGTEVLVIEPASPSEGGAMHVGALAHADAEYIAGKFGLSGQRLRVSVHETVHKGADVLMRTDMAADARQSTEIAAGMEQRSGAGVMRMVARYGAYPELDGEQAFALQSAHELTLGDNIRVEIGGQVRAVHRVRTAMQAEPFVRVTGRTGDGWTIQYRMATSPELQGFDDLDGVDEAVPVAVSSDGRVLLDGGRHQELKVAKAYERGSIYLAVYHDSMQRTAIAGVGLPGPADGLSVDRTAGTFRVLGGSYGSSGIQVAANTPLSRHLVGTLEYTTGEAMGLTEPASGTIQAAVAGMKARGAQAASVAVHGNLGPTKLHVSYRWQTAGTLNAIDPYGDGGDEGYLSFSLRQPLHWSGHLPSGVEATVSITNLLAQGYRPFLTDDGQLLYFAQAPRTMQAGLAFCF